MLVAPTPLTAVGTLSILSLRFVFDQIMSLSLVLHVGLDFVYCHFTSRARYVPTQIPGFGQLSFRLRKFRRLPLISRDFSFPDSLSRFRTPPADASRFRAPSQTIGKANVRLFLEQGISKSANRMDCVSNNDRCRLCRVWDGEPQETRAVRLIQRWMQFVISTITTDVKRPVSVQYTQIDAQGGSWAALI
jgi:hypothetical protein